MFSSGILWRSWDWTDSVLEIFLECSGRDEDGLPSGVTGGGTNSTTDNRRIFAFVPSAVGLVVGLNKTEVNYESAAASWRSTAMLRAGACVIDPKGVVSIICDEV